MDDVVADVADHEGLASLSRHELRPWRLWLPRFAEVGELADVVDFHLAGVLAHLASSRLEPLDQLGAADDDARGWLAVGEDRLVGGNVDDRLGEGVRGFLRKVVPDTALDPAMPPYRPENLPA
jgi:hypothetical protein